MIKRTRYTGNNGYSYIIDELRKRLGNETAEKIVDDTVTYGNELWKEYDHLSKKEKLHVQDMIIPRAAFYLQMRKYLPEEEAIGLIEEAIRIGVEKEAAMLKKWTRLPLVRSMFMKFGPKLMNSVFGKEAGFKTETICCDRKRFRFDILDCPYHRTCTKLGCPELTKTFCLSDDYVYGSMNKIDFIRHGSIGRGYDRCDFDFRRTDI